MLDGLHMWLLGRWYNFASDNARRSHEVQMDAMRRIVKLNFKMRLRAPKPENRL